MYEKSFVGRISELYDESRMSVKEFADQCNLSRQSMQYYLKGERMPDSAQLQKICQACSVSADWLLGLTEVRTISADIQNAVATLGLSEDATEKIMSLTKKDQLGNALSDLIEQSEFEELVRDYNEFLKLGAKVWEKMPDMPDPTIPQSFEISSDGYITLSVFDALVYYSGKVESVMKSLCGGRIFRQPLQDDEHLKDYLKKEE